MDGQVGEGPRRGRVGVQRGEGGSENGVAESGPPASWRALLGEPGPQSDDEDQIDESIGDEVRAGWGLLELEVEQAQYAAEPVAVIVVSPGDEGVGQGLQQR